MDSLSRPLEDAVKAGSLCDRGRKANTNAVLFHVGADNVEGGRAAARFIMKNGEKGTVIEWKGHPELRRH